MKVVLLGCLLVGFATAAEAASSEVPYIPDLRGQTVQCADFKPGSDGTWTTVRPITVQRQNEYTQIAADSSFKAGGPKTAGMDVGAMLDAVCPR